MRNTLRNSKGFTIFELIVVIAILGILAAVLFPKMMGREASAKIQSIEMDMLRLSEASQAWKANMGLTNYDGLDYDTLGTAGLWSGKKNPWGSDFNITVVDVGSCSKCGVKIDSGTLSDTTIQDQLFSRLTAKGYSPTKVASPLSVTYVSGS